MVPTIRELRESDFLPVIECVDRWWGRPVSGALRRLFFEHFRPMSRVAEHDGQIVGFQSQTDPAIAYAHFIGIAPEFRRHGLARHLYDLFFHDARNRGCKCVDCITSPVNKDSIAFHQRIGFQILPGELTVDGLAVSKDHEGPGQHRVRMRRAI